MTTPTVCCSTNPPNAFVTCPEMSPVSRTLRPLQTRTRWSMIGEPERNARDRKRRPR